MKGVLTIWMFYLMLLSLLPCSDTSNKCMNESIAAGTAAPSSHNHNHDSDDQCSPFCYCNCCSITIASFDFKPIEIQVPKPAFFSYKIVLEDPAPTSQYDGNIWNPPKLIG